MALRAQDSKTPQRPPLTAERILEPIRTQLGQCVQDSAVNKANFDIEKEFTTLLQARVAQLEKEKTALEAEIAQLKSAPGGIVKP